MRRIRLNRISSTILAIAFLVQPRSSAQTVDSALAYFPMHVGDVWEYNGYMLSNTPYYSLHVEITGDTLATYGRTYKIFKEVNSLTGTTISWKRIDSLTGSVYLFDPTRKTEIQRDSLRARPGDSFNLYTYYATWYEGIDTGTVLGVQTLVKSFHEGPNFPRYKLAYGIGMIYWDLDDGMSIGLQWRTIVYEKVTGVEHGSSLRVTKQTAAPSKYSLGQNYPNPFNPNTTIEYYLPKTSSAKITIFNTIGQVVAQWSYAERPPGRYSLKWEPQLPSAVYFYKLEAISNSQPPDRYSQTRKMILVR